MTYEPDRLNEHHYLILYVLLVIPIAVSFLFVRRGSKPPVKLRMGSSGERGQVGSGSGGEPQVVARPVSGVSRGVSGGGPISNLEFGAPSRPRTKLLNINFNWNGHSFDAYEVLGVAAGSSIETAHAAYLSSLEGADPDTKLFFKAAYDAILSTY